MEWLPCGDPISPEALDVLSAQSVTSHQAIIARCASLVPVGLVHQSRVLEGLIERRAKIGTRARPDDRHEQCRLDAVLHTEVHGDCAVLQVEKLNER